MTTSTLLHSFCLLPVRQLWLITFLVAPVKTVSNASNRQLKEGWSCYPPWTFIFTRKRYFWTINNQRRRTLWKKWEQFKTKLGSIGHSIRNLILIVGRCPTLEKAHYNYLAYHYLTVSQSALWYSMQKVASVLLLIE